MRTNVFKTEDAPMIEGQQRRIGDHDFFELKPLLMASDNAPVRVRRILARLIAAERRVAVASTETLEGTANHG